MWSRLKNAAVEGLVMGVKASIALLVVGVLVTWVLKDYALMRGTAVSLNQSLGLKDKSGHLLSRLDLLDLCIQDFMDRQQAAAKAVGPTAPQTPATK